MKKLMLMLVLVCAACGGDDDKEKGGSVSTGIGPDGGTVNGPNGSYVTVPAGALSQMVTLTIASSPSDAPALSDGVALAGVVYALTPHGTSFAHPALLHVAYDTSKVTAGQTPAIYKAEVGGTYTALTTTVGDGFLEASIDGFSYVAPVAPNTSATTYSQLSGQCGRRSLSGIVDCWGHIEKIAQNDGVDPVTPTPVAGGRAFGQFASSFQFICGVSGTELWCAGDNQYGELGDGTNDPSAAAVKVSAPPGIALRSVTTGSQHACALVASSDPEQDGKAYCWGYNSAGQVGLGDTESPILAVNTPQAIASSYRYADIYASARTTCAIRSTGEVDCWGDNSYGQLGFGYDATGRRRTPGQVEGITALAETGALSGGGRTFCALTTDGAKCWGYNEYGTIGDGTQGGGNTSDPNARKSPSLVAGGHQFARIAWSSNAACGSEASGATFCWGAVTDTSNPWLTPQAMVGVPNSYKAMTGVTGNASFCGITTDTSKTYCWGGNSFGELGNGQATTNDDYISPQPLPNQN